MTPSVFARQRQEARKWRGGGEGAGRGGGYRKGAGRSDRSVSRREGKGSKGRGDLDGAAAAEVKVSSGKGTCSP